MYSPRLEHLAELQKQAPLATLQIALNELDAKEKIRIADVVLGNRYLIQSLPFAKKLRWVQSNSAGMDLILSSPFAKLPFVLTSARGLYTPEIAEHAISLAFALARSLHLYRDDQKKGIWNRLPLTQISGANCLLLGYGSIGQAIGKRLAALGAHVFGVSKKDGDTWKELLPNTHFLFSTLPLTPLTHHLISHPIFDRLPPHAFFISVGRGGVVDEQALLEKIRSFKLQGAALDVFEEEPLPPHHPFWAEERILLTPHVSRSPESTPNRWEPLFAENLGRFYREEPLLNLVDKEAGY